ncbi:MAG: DUF1841 family protein [Kofleriaceae bacterium]
MATCSYCQRRKGKRTCPALGGSICSLCCGKHRLAEISCPSGCVHLGGLALVREPEVATGFTKDDYNAAWAGLNQFGESAGNASDTAYLRFFDLESPPEEWEMAIASGYVFYGYRDAKGRRVVDRFLAERGRALPRGQVAALMALQQSWASLFEIVAVKRAVGFELRDLVSGKTVSVREVSATEQLKQWDVLFAWLMPVDDQLELTGSVCVVPRAHLDVVRSALETAIAEARNEYPELLDRQLAAMVAWAPVKAMREAVRNSEIPTLSTSDGDAMLFCKAHYRVDDEARVRERLEQAPELTFDGHGYAWIEPPSKGRKRSTPVVLGFVRIGDGELVLETMSRERNDRGKRMLDGMLGDAIVRGLDSIQDPESAMRHAKQQPRSSAPELPADEQAELIGSMLRDHYRQWLDDALPALGGKTPRQAARTKTGRDQVDALLKDIENSTLGMPGGASVDFAGMRRELGLDGAKPRAKRPARGASSYDAEQAPDPEAWLAMTESRRTKAIEAHHRSLSDHPDTPNGQLHAIVHMVVENQLAAQDPPEVHETLARLLKAGLTRHEAIHAIGSVVAEAMFKIARDAAPSDPAVMARSLKKLRPAQWRFVT